MTPFHRPDRRVQAARQKLMARALKPSIRKVIELDPLLADAKTALSKTIDPAMVRFTAKGREVVDAEKWHLYRNAWRRFQAQKAQSLRELAEEALRQAAQLEAESQDPASAPPRPASPSTPRRGPPHKRTGT